MAHYTKLATSSVPCISFDCLGCQVAIFLYHLPMQWILLELADNVLLFLRPLACVDWLQFVWSSQCLKLTCFEVLWIVNLVGINFGWLILLHVLQGRQVAHYFHLVHIHVHRVSIFHPRHLRHNFAVFNRAHIFQTFKICNWLTDYPVWRLYFWNNKRPVIATQYLERVISSWWSFSPRSVGRLLSWKFILIVLTWTNDRVFHFWHACVICS